MVRRKGGSQRLGTPAIHLTRACLASCRGNLAYDFLMSVRPDHCKYVPCFTETFELSTGMVRFHNHGVVQPVIIVISHDVRTSHPLTSFFSKGVVMYYKEGAMKKIAIFDQSEQR